ncbi:Chromo domain-containing protein [Mycena kentingensis (nom. inval.)]|nr:Chromo domain-containing protein [Mycena kentingensis (nom. inval.)]
MPSKKRKREPSPEPERFYVETIVRARRLPEPTKLTSFDPIKLGGWEYEVKWAGWPSSDNSWETIGNLRSKPCKALIKRFWENIEDGDPAGTFMVNIAGVTVRPRKGYIAEECLRFQKEYPQAEVDAQNANPFRPLKEWVDDDPDVSNKIVNTQPKASKAKAKSLSDPTPVALETKASKAKFTLDYDNLGPTRGKRAKKAANDAGEGADEQRNDEEARGIANDTDTDGEPQTTGGDIRGRETSRREQRKSRTADRKGKGKEKEKERKTPMRLEDVLAEPETQPAVAGPGPSTSGNANATASTSNAASAPELPTPAPSPSRRATGGGVKFYNPPGLTYSAATRERRSVPAEAFQLLLRDPRGETYDGEGELDFMNAASSEASGWDFNGDGAGVEMGPQTEADIVARGLKATTVNQDYAPTPQIASMNVPEIITSRLSQTKVAVWVSDAEDAWQVLHASQLRQGLLDARVTVVGAEDHYAQFVFVHERAMGRIHELPQLGERRRTAEVVFFSFGAGGIAEIYPRGGVVTLTSEAILQNLQGALRLVANYRQTFWKVCIVPKIVAALARMHRNMSETTTTTQLLEAFVQGHIELLHWGGGEGVSLIRGTGSMEELLASTANLDELSGPVTTEELVEYLRTMQRQPKFFRERRRFVVLDSNSHEPDFVDGVERTGMQKFMPLLFAREL